MRTSKNNCKFFATLCTGLLLTACSSEEILTDTDTESTGRVMYATAAYNEDNSPKTRMSYEDDLVTNYMKLAWSEGDKFSSFISTDEANTKYEFAIEAPKDGKEYTANESFKCSNFAQGVADGTVIDAIYPSVSDASPNPKNLTLSLTDQVQVGNKNTDHLKQYDYMVGHAIYHSETPDELNFSFTDHGDGNAGRLASIYRVTLTLPAGVGKVESIKLTAKNKNGGASLADVMALNFAQGAISTVPSSHEGVTLKVTNGTTETSDGNNKFIAYVMLYPSLVKTLTTTVTTDMGVFTKPQEYPNEIIFTRGEFKILDVDLVNETPDLSSFTTYNQVGKGTATEPYLIMNETQLRDLATQNNLTPVSSETYFKLVYDIDLGEKEWTPIATYSNPFSGIFDGNGHTVKGLVVNGKNEDQGFFGYLGKGSVVKELSVEGKVIHSLTDDTQASGYGILAGGNKGSIIACSTVGTVTTNGNTTMTGGLVGTNNGTIIACSAAATVTANGAETTRTGGLVGINNGYIIACYAIGTVTATNQEYVGSLVGRHQVETRYCLTTGNIGTATDDRHADNNNGKITGIGVYVSGYITSCHGGITSATLNAEGEVAATGIGFGMMNHGITWYEWYENTTIPYRWVAGTTTPVVVAVP